MPNGENMALNNACVLNKCHFRTNNILSNNSIEIVGFFGILTSNSKIYGLFRMWWWAEQGRGKSLGEKGRNYSNKVI